MSRVAYIDGRYQPLDVPGVLVEDRGYQFADGVYEVCAIRNGQLLDETEHLDRLDYSLAELDIPAPMSRAALKLVMRETMRRNRLRNGLLYMQITRGVAPRAHTYPSGLPPVLVVTVRPLAHDRRQKLLRDGIEVISMPDQRWARCDIKSISLLPNVMVRQTAHQNGAQEAWQIDRNGLVTEGAATNAWIVDADGRLRTRPSGNDILNGIVRQILMHIAKEQGHTLCEEAFSLEEALGARECFSTASTMTVFPVVKIDGIPIGDGKPGPVALALVAAYDKRK